jgi:hypothetical protein
MMSESDDRRGALHRYLTDLCQTGEYDFDLLQIAAVAYLKNWMSPMRTVLQGLPRIKLFLKSGSEPGLRDRQARRHAELGPIPRKNK